MFEITGRTRCYPLIGFPVDQVRTPPGINAWFRRQGIDAVMFGIDIAPVVVTEFFATLKGWRNCGGCSVTVPHKQGAFRAMEELTERAARIGAVNIVRRQADGCLQGDMTDGVAFLAALRRSGADPRGKTVLLTGAGGGAGAAIADSLCEAGIHSICLWEPDNLRRASVESMLAANHPHVQLSFEWEVDYPFDIAINASPLGMRPEDPLPFDPGLVSLSGFVADIVTKPEVTPLLCKARQSGRNVQIGNAMADMQIEFQMRHLGLWPDEACAVAVG